MLISDYNPTSARVLSTARSDALDWVRAAIPRMLDEHEEFVLSRRLTRNLTSAYDVGERDPDALRCAALHGILTSKARN